jgi:hypothetical protein
MALDERREPFGMVIDEWRKPFGSKKNPEDESLPGSLRTAI